MNALIRPTYQVVIFCTIILTLLSVLWGDSFAWLELAIFITAMIVTGIPHGATDHLIYRFRQRQEGREVSYLYFLGVYVFAILFYSAVWYAMPAISLLIFLLISAYHFGQSQFLRISLPENNFLKQTLYVSWGLYTLGVIILLNWGESLEIMKNLMPSGEMYLNFVGSFRYQILVTLTLLTLILLCIVSWKSGANMPYLLSELFNMLLLFTVSYFASLLISFAIYFGLWHSLASISVEVEAFRRENPGFNFRSFFLAALPFTIVSFVGIGILLLISNLLGGVLSPYMLFFIAISALTLPHMIFMQRFYVLQPWKQTKVSV